MKRLPFKKIAQTMKQAEERDQPSREICFQPTFK